MGKTKPNLKAVPAPDATTETPEQPEETTYSFRDMLRDNVKLVDDLSKEFSLEPEVVVNIMGLSINFHLAQRQLRQYEDAVR